MDRPRGRDGAAYRQVPQSGEGATPFGDLRETPMADREKSRLERPRTLVGGREAAQAPDWGIRSIRALDQPWSRG